MRLLADESFPRAAVERIRAAGYDKDFRWLASLAGAGNGGYGLPMDVTKQDLHRLVDELPEGETLAAHRFLEFLRKRAEDPVGRNRSAVGG